MSNGRKEIENHVTLLGILNIVWGFLGVAGAMAIVTIMVLPAILANMSREHYYMRVPPEGCAALGIVGIIGTSIAGFMLLVFLPTIVGGIGLLLKKSWARILVIIVSIVHLLAFPLGTALGIYGLWVLWDKSKFDTLIVPPTKDATA